MNEILNVLDPTEHIIFSLRDLYRKNGYKRYKMDKFEDYDLYGQNREFLVSDRLITFTDGSGRLKALKPDVTLSVVLNSHDLLDDVEKFCYNESVYRMDADGVFREIDQTGIECIGKVDEACMDEVLSLAAKSLSLISDKYVLSLSELTILSSFIKKVVKNVEPKRQEEVEKALFAALGRRSKSGILEIAEEAQAEEKDVRALIGLLTLPQDTDEAIAILRVLLAASEATDLTEDDYTDPEPKEASEALTALLKLEEHIECLKAAGLKAELDFSLAGDLHYYNGIVFQGFLEGVPESVLSGGQYDGLMRSMGMRANAAGFAVYLDRIQNAGIQERTAGGKES